jgi:hypothetical protein
MIPHDHPRAEALLAAYRRSTAPVDEAALLRSIVARIVADEPDEPDADAAEDAAEPLEAPRSATARRRSLVPRVVAIGIALAAGLVLVLSLEGRGLQAEEDARRFQSNDGHGGAPGAGRIWLSGTAESGEGEAQDFTAEPGDPARTPRHGTEASEPASPEPRGASRGSRSGGRASEPGDPSDSSPPAPRSRDGIGALRGWPGVDDEPNEPRTGGAGGLPAGSGSGGDPKEDDDAKPGRDGSKRAPKSSPRSQPSGDSGPSGDPSPPSPPPPRDGSDPKPDPDPEPQPGCESEHLACLESDAPAEMCQEGLGACLLGQACEADHAACLEAGIDQEDCDAWWQACVSPAPSTSCAEEYDGCMQQIGDPVHCFVVVEACVQATPEAFECELYGAACIAAFPEDPPGCESLMAACWSAFDPCSEDPEACGNFDPQLLCDEQLDGCLSGIPPEDPQLQPVVEQCWAEHEMCLSQSPPPRAPMPEDECMQAYGECTIAMPEDPATCEGDYVECIDELG